MHSYERLLVIECISERIIKIGSYLLKLSRKDHWMFYFDSQRCTGGSGGSSRRSSSSSILVVEVDSLKMSLALALS